jgi:hypothetical protein
MRWKKSSPQTPPKRPRFRLATRACAKSEEPGGRQLVPQSVIPEAGAFRQASKRQASQDKRLRRCSQQVIRAAAPESGCWQPEYCDCAEFAVF